jgi:hypothetical protein
LVLTPRQEGRRHRELQAELKDWVKESERLEITAKTRGCVAVLRVLCLK